MKTQTRIGHNLTGDLKISSKGLSGGIYKPLSPEGTHTIHDASLNILEKTGITFEANLEETVDMLAKADTAVDRKDSHIRFPRELIHRTGCQSTVPGSPPRP